ncbi:MAG: OmpA family protein [Bacteroidota bacterium]|jgi:outer membrane protein OmpA-like peptidoglycan-associated protein|nr:OmpA family protein [Bacteroidota bacterium]
MKKYLCLLLIISFSAARSQVINHTIYFDSGKSDIKSSESRWFDSVSSIIIASNYFIKISAYCDADGSESSNLILARARGWAARELFTDRLKSDLGLQVYVVGEAEPVGDNSTTKGKAANRRIDIMIDYKAVPNETPPIETIKTPQPQNPVISENETDFKSAKLEVGETLILKNLNFEGGTPILLAQSEPVLKDLLKFMQDNPTLEIEIGGHVCCGPDYELSVLRAKKVYNYLKNYGVDPKRMSYKGYSFDKPIASEQTEEGRTANRRVEITILKL